MPLIKIDSTHPEALLEVLKEMNFTEGTEIDIEQHEDGILLKPHHTTLKRPQSGREIIERLDQELSKIRGDIPADSTDLDSEWWIKTIREGKVIKDLKVDLD